MGTRNLRLRSGTQPRTAETKGRLLLEQVVRRQRLLCPGEGEANGPPELAVCQVCLSYPLPLWKCHGRAAASLTAQRPLSAAALLRTPACHPAPMNHGGGASLQGGRNLARGLWFIQPREGTSGRAVVLPWLHSGRGLQAWFSSGTPDGRPSGSPF